MMILRCMGPLSPFKIHQSPGDYCRRDKDMPKGRLYNWEGMATM
jgi:hypothetical protein